MIRPGDLKWEAYPSAVLSASWFLGLPDGTTVWSETVDGVTKRRVVPPGRAGFGLLLPDNLIECDYCEEFAVPLDQALDDWPMLLRAERLHFRVRHPGVDPRRDRPPWCSEGCWGADDEDEREEDE